MNRINIHQGVIAMQIEPYIYIVARPTRPPLAYKLAASEVCSRLILMRATQHVLVEILHGGEWIQREILPDAIDVYIPPCFFSTDELHFCACTQLFLKDECFRSHKDRTKYDLSFPIMTKEEKQDLLTGSQSQRRCQVSSEHQVRWSAILNGKHQLIHCFRSPP